MPGQDQTLCIEPCDGEARRELRRATRRNTEIEKDLISTVIHLCIEPCDGEARRELRRATRRNTEIEKDAEQTFESFSLSVGFEPVKENEIVRTPKRK